jgi:hypothetical protein
LADAANVFLSTGATLDLGFAGAHDTVESLFIDGVMQPTGTWGAVGSGADFTSPWITGTGMLQVTTFVEPVPGDYNGDGAVSADDYDIWRATFGQTAAIGSGADGNRNGEIDAGDYVVWRRQMQAGFPVGFSATGVPEPASIGLLFILLALRGALRSRCNSRYSRYPGGD